MEEEKLVATNHGKWSKAGIPHRGWVCIDIEDLGALDGICEMCESQMIRHVHYMQHPNYDGVLGVGCICAGNMEGNIYAAQKRENAMISRRGKRNRWLSRKWRISQKGNEYIRAYGYCVTIFRREEGWAASMALLDDKNSLKFSRKKYPSPEEAKLSAFDYITRAEAENG
jgi:hypothetical protein